MTTQDITDSYYSIGLDLQLKYESCRFADKAGQAAIVTWYMGASQGPSFYNLPIQWEIASL